MSAGFNFSDTSILLLKPEHWDLLSIHVVSNPLIKNISDRERTGPNYQIPFHQRWPEAKLEVNRGSFELDDLTAGSGHKSLSSFGFTKDGN